MTEQTSWDLGGDSISFPFDNPGDFVDGIVCDVADRQSTDMETGQPAFWDNGDKKMLTVVTLQTQLRDPANRFDDGKRTVALSGSKKPESQSRMAAVVSAIREATGGSRIQYGARLALRYTGDGVATRRGFSPPKYYDAKYWPPTRDLGAPVAAQQAAPPPPPAPEPEWSTPPAPPQMASTGSSQAGFFAGGDDEPPF